MTETTPAPVLPEAEMEAGNIIQEEENPNEIMIVEEEPTQTEEQEGDVDPPTLAVEQLATAPIFNRFSNWRSRARETTVASLFRKTSSAVQLESASLSPQSREESAGSMSVESQEDGNNGNLQKKEFHRSRSSESSDDSDSDYSESTTSRATSATTSSSNFTALQRAMVDTATAASSNASTLFRGRYNNATTPRTANHNGKPPLRPTPQSTRILNSAHSQHWQQVCQDLVADQPSRYVLLLGRGMLGVNLKSCFRKHTGVYVDYTVLGGAADQSGVVRVGDSLCRVGDTDSSKGTIRTVPSWIAEAPRPVPIVLSTAGTAADEAKRMSHMDVLVAALHLYVIPKPKKVTTASLDGESSTIGSLDSGSRRSKEDEELVNVTGMKLMAPTSFDDDENPFVSSETIELLDSLEEMVFVPPPPTELCEVWLSHMAKRNNDFTFSELKLEEAVVTHVPFRHALRNALLACIADVRRLAFLRNHMAMQLKYQKEQQQQARRGETVSIFADETAQAMLDLLIELSQYVQLYDVMSAKHRKAVADHVAHKYFFPTILSKTELVPPMYDFHQIVPDKVLRDLEAALKTDEIKQGIFLEFHREVANRLSSSRWFLSFLISSECARMRAYLRGTAPVVGLPLGKVLQECEKDNPEAHSYVMYMIAYLLSKMDREEMGENDDFENEGDDKPPRRRMEHAATGFCACLYLRAQIIPMLRKATSVDAIKDILELAWITLLSPGVGSLSSHQSTPSAFYSIDKDLSGVHEHIADLINELKANDGPPPDLTKLVQALQDLSDHLLFEYASLQHSHFLQHKFHEWICEEMLQARDIASGTSSQQIPPLKEQNIKRLLRKIQWPTGVAPHKPLHMPDEKPIDEERSANFGADFAIVFGSEEGSDSSMMTRYACEALGDDPEQRVAMNELLSSVESYAFSSSSRHKHFQQYLKPDLSIGGFDVSLVDFVMPRPENEDGESFLYGVSLALQRKANYESVGMFDQQDSSCRKLLDELVQVIESSGDIKQHTTETAWSRRHGSDEDDADNAKQVVVGLVLVAEKNVIPAMRQSLSLLVQTFNEDEDAELPSLVDLLGCFEKEVDTTLIPQLLRPFLEEASKPWLEKPVGCQAAVFEQACGHQLIGCLPPIPLALMFLTALLEQKIVLTSSRKSVLLSATTALSAMLKPLNWCHLLVPRVPPELASDLLQYPAPFILGMPSEDPGVMELIRDLEDDVTLVDLDVGRVILAPAFAHSSELARGVKNDAAVARKLRSQVLFLAQSLGTVFGPCLDSGLWHCDLPCRSNDQAQTTSTSTPFDRLKVVCTDFIEELLAGVSSCCYWFDDKKTGASSSDPTVLFDEDRFFRIKFIRHDQRFQPLFGAKRDSQHLAVSSGDFDLIVELFLRCQSMNEYIGTRKREDMMFFLG